jgi:hypothetical protein
MAVQIAVDLGRTARRQAAHFFQRRLRRAGGQSLPDRTARQLDGDADYFVLLARKTV